MEEEYGFSIVVNTGDSELMAEALTALIVNAVLGGVKAESIVDADKNKEVWPKEERKCNK